MTDILNLSIAQAKNKIEQAGFASYRTDQILDWIYKKHVCDFSKMTNISKKDREKLEELFTIGLPEVIKSLESRDGTVKSLMSLKDGNVIESVLMEYNYGHSLCISSQAGCRMNCSFCASGKNGLARDLTTGEMIGQIIAMSRKFNKDISRVVVMGIGEPFDNYDNFIGFVENAINQQGLEMGQRRITVSTCGIVPGICKFADYNSQVNLSVSLHETDNKSRSAIMPINRKYPIEELLKACRYYINKTNRRISFEYALIPGQNDSIDKAHALAGLLKDMLCYVNIIPINKIEGVSYDKNLIGSASHFYDILRKNKIHATVRRELGSDIEAACGQLRRSHVDEIRRRNK